MARKRIIKAQTAPAPKASQEQKPEPALVDLVKLLARIKAEEDYQRTPEETGVAPGRQGKPK